jgi:hypothetical protein
MWLYIGSATHWKLVERLLVLGNLGWLCAFLGAVMEF